MTARALFVLQGVAIVVALVVVGSSFWWAAQTPVPPTATGLRPVPADTTLVDATPEAGAPTTPQALTPTPTATPTPIPTPTPVPVSFLDAIDGADWQDLLASPMPACQFAPAGAAVAGARVLTCANGRRSVPVVAAAEGRVVHVVREEAMPEVPAQPPGSWSWLDQGALGPHVVVDHGSYGGRENVQTVYAGLATIADDVAVGTVVAAGRELGTASGPAATMLFSVWADDVRQDGVSTEVAAPPVEVQRVAALALRDTIVSPTDPLCPLVVGASQLPGAARPYRNGTHRGIDFGCGAGGRFAHAIASGTVVYLVDDYSDPSVADREALLASAGRARFTPQWTLAMLYGNVVVIDHGDIEGAGRVVTIAAHLEEVASDVTLGAEVVAGQVLGEIGNRGTNASAQGLRGGQDPSLHLHWELFIDGWYLGAGLDSQLVAELVTTALCGAAATPGCPA